MEVLISVYDEKNVEDKNVLAEVYNNYSKVLSMEGNTEIALGKALDAERLIDSISEDSDKEYYLRNMIWYLWLSTVITEIGIEVLLTI